MTENAALAQLPRTGKEVRRAAQQFDISRHRNSWNEMVDIKRRIAELENEYAVYAERFKALIGEADEIVLDGEIVATHAVSSKFKTREFRNNYPDLAEEFTVQRLVETIDEEALREKHPWLFQASRSRSLRFK